MTLFARSRCWFLSGLIGVVCLAGCGSSRTPEKVFTDWSNAVKVGDFHGAWECLTPQTRGTVLQILVMDADLLAENSTAAKTALDQAFQKQGLNPQDAGFKQQRLAVANSAELAADLDSVFRQYLSELEKLPASRYAKLNAIWQATAQAGLSQSQIDGVRATAGLQGTIPHVPENASIQAVFEKINNQWLFSELEQGVGGAAVAGAQPGGAAMPGMPGGAMPGMPGGAPGGAMPGMPGAPGGGAAAMDPKMMMQPGGNPTNPGQPPVGAAAAMDPKMMMPPGGNPTNPGQPPAGAAAAMDPKMMKPGSFPTNPGQPPAGGPAGMSPEMMKKYAESQRQKAGQPPPGGAPPIDPRMMKPGGALPVNPGQPPVGGLNPANPIQDAAGRPDRKNMPLDPRGKPADPGLAAPGNNRGRPNFPAGGNAFRGNGPGGQNRQDKPGSFEYVINEFTSKMAAGDYTELDSLISTRARGQLAKLRDGEVDDEQKAELAAAFEDASVESNTRKNRGATLEIHVKGNQGHLIVLAAGKDKGEFKIRDMKIHEPGASKNR